MAVIKSETFHEAWDCNVCDTKGLSAFSCKQCPNCGAPLDEEGVYRSRRPAENYNFKGYDVICAHCETRNEKRFSCRNCGASLTDGDDVRVKSFIFKSESDGKPPPKQRPQSRASRQRPSRKVNLSKVNSPNGVVNRKWWYLGSAVAILSACIAIWFYSQLNAVITATLTAEQAHWDYHLPLEDFAPRHETMTVVDGGFGSPPSNAYDVDSTQVFIRSDPIYETRTVSQTCTGTSSSSNGDGTWTETTYTYDCSYTEQVQVGTNDIWGTRYDYTVDRWESISPLARDGWGHETNFPTFTTPNVCLSTRPTYGCERAPGEPQLTFTIHFFYFENGEEERHDVSRTMERDVWDGFHLGKDYPAILNGFGTIRAIAGIDPEYQELIGD